jgi:hypothetical protein
MDPQPRGAVTHITQERGLRRVQEKVSVVKKWCWRGGERRREKSRGDDV